MFLWHLLVACKPSLPVDDDLARSFIGFLFNQGSRDDKYICTLSNSKTHKNSIVIVLLLQIVKF